MQSILFSKYIAFYNNFNNQLLLESLLIFILSSLSLLINLTFKTYKSDVTSKTHLTTMIHMTVPKKISMILDINKMGVCIFDLAHLLKNCFLLNYWPDFMISMARILVKRVDQHVCSYSFYYTTHKNFY